MLNVLSMYFSPQNCEGDQVFVNEGCRDRHLDNCHNRKTFMIFCFLKLFVIILFFYFRLRE